MNECSLSASSPVTAVTVTRCQFHQRSMYSLYARRSQKRKKILTNDLTVFFPLLGSTSVKAVRRTLMKLSPGQLETRCLRCFIFLLQRVVANRCFNVITGFPRYLRNMRLFHHIGQRILLIYFVIVKKLISQTTRAAPPVLKNTILCCKPV